MNAYQITVTLSQPIKPGQDTDDYRLGVANELNRALELTGFKVESVETTPYTEAPAQGCMWAGAEIVGISLPFVHYHELSDEDKAEATSDHGDDAEDNQYVRLGQILYSSSDILLGTVSAFDPEGYWQGYYALCYSTAHVFHLEEGDDGPVCTIGYIM